VTELLSDRIDTPLGGLIVVVEGGRVCAIAYAGHEERLERELRARYGNLRLRESTDSTGASARLRAYFAGDYAALDAIEVDPGGTPFQREVWSALRGIPAGTTVSYGTIARRIGRPTATRAVGLTNGLNPVPIVIPCHRVIGADGSLTGYGSGLPIKDWLLRHEGAQLQLGIGGRP
jgi:methylated-DNA-[protein]-cysteine S-methyltransferase